MPESLYGVLCTYRRPTAARTYLDHLEQQSRPPDIVIVVDNGSDPVLAEAVRARPVGAIEYRYIDPGANIGPAGAFRLGFDSAAADSGPDDLLIHLDDDDPPVTTTAIAELLAVLRAEMGRDQRVSGVGLSGGNLDLRTGIVQPPRRHGDVGDVDHLHGGYLPIYRLAALASVEANDPSFWFGFEELELGRRLTLAGWKLVVDLRQWATVQDKYPKRASPARGSESPSWSRFHKDRNLVRILCRERRWMALAVTVLGRFTIVPLVRAPLHPVRAAQRILMEWRAAIAGVRNQGGIDPRYVPPSALSVPSS